MSYVSPADAAAGSETPREVRFLAPFDPVVWDRTRFEHLWGWAYRFEAYAMPMLWGDQIIGWANAGARGARGARGAADVTVGFVNKRPRGPEFRRGLAAEIARLTAFLAEPGT